MSLKKSVEAEIMSQIFESQKNPEKWKVLILDRLTTLILSGMQLRSNLMVMSRVILAPDERLTPFDLRTQTFRVHVELSTNYHRHTRKINFRAERLLSDIFSIFFSSSVAKIGVKRCLQECFSKC